MRLWTSRPKGAITLSTDARHPHISSGPQGFRITPWAVVLQLPHSHQLVVDELAKVRGTLLPRRCPRTTPRAMASGWYIHWRGGGRVVGHWVRGALMCCGGRHRRDALKVAAVLACTSLECCVSSACMACRLPAGRWIQMQAGLWSDWVSTQGGVKN